MSKSDAGLMRETIGDQHGPLKLAQVWSLAFRIYREMLVLEVLRDALCLFHLDLFGRGIQRIVSFAAFCSAAHVRGGVSQGNSSFGQADKFDGLLRGDCQWQRFWIGKTNIFTRENDNASRDESEILAGVQHFREPVHSGFFV